MILAFGLALACLLVVGLWLLVLAGEKGHEKARRWKMGLEDVRGFLLHPGLFYHRGHTWVMPQEDGTVRIGLDDFSRRLVDGVVKVALPAKGSEVRQGRAAAQLDCGEKRAELFSPVTGLVTAVNESLAKNGSALERDPYGKGWLFTARVSNQKFKKLPTGVAAKEWLEREIGRLSVFLQGELGATAADGGDLIPKPPRVLSKEQWENLVETFLHASEEGEIEN
jgi:glycine cleavage system H lipoate-binding protein